MTSKRELDRYIPEPNKPFENLNGDHTLRYMFAKQLVDGAAVLDAGCGCGYGSKHLADNGAQSISAIDIDRSAIKYAKKHYDLCNLDFAVVDGTHLSFRDNSFDVVTSIEVIEHVPNFREYLKEIHRILKPKGVLLISTPNKQYDIQKGLFLVHHIQEFYPDEFYHLLREYFGECLLYGKRIVDQQILRKQNNLVGRIKSSIIKLAALAFPHYLIKRMPGIVINMGGVLFTENVAFKPDDFEISQTNIKKASNLIAVCKVRKVS